MKKNIIGCFVVMLIVMAMICGFNYRANAQTKTYQGEIDRYVGDRNANFIRMALVKELGDEYSFITRYLGDNKYELVVVDGYDCFIFTLDADETEIKTISNDVEKWVEDHYVDICVVCDDVQYNYDEAIAYGLIDQ